MSREQELFGEQEVLHELREAVLLLDLRPVPASERWLQPHSVSVVTHPVDDDVDFRALVFDVVNILADAIIAVIGCSAAQRSAAYASSRQAIGGWGNFRLRSRVRFMVFLFLDD